MHRLRRTKPLTLTTKVMILSLIPMTLLGAALTRTMHHRIATRALADATTSARMIAHVGVLPHLTPSDLAHGVSAQDRKELDWVLSAFGRRAIARIKIWNQNHEVVYSDDPKLIGRRLAPSHDLLEALSGRAASDISSTREAENIGERKLGHLLEVYTPLRLRAGANPDGAFELYVPYGPVAATIASDTRMIIYQLLIGLGLLWAALFRIVSRTSRRLRRHAAENRFMARHDALTELPNRVHFRESIEAALGEDAAAGFAVVLLDLDRFKEINDTLGHDIGDELLRAVGGRIAAAVRPGDTVARLGGDEFALLLPGIADRVGAELRAGRVVEVLEAPFAIEQMSLDVGASAGVALAPLDGSDAEALIRRADVAMYLAKESGSRVECYDRRRDLHSTARLALLGELRRALEAGALVVHYQPKARLDTGGISGLEALVRWDHPRRGLVPPEEFVGLAEQSGLIGELTGFVLERALADLAAFHERGLDLSVAVNVSVRNLLDQSLPERIEQLFELYPSTRGRLELEITETDILGDARRVAPVLQRLAANGVELAIDDFGTGYASLAQLRTLAVSTIKVDKSFVLGIAAGSPDEAIVDATVHLARSLGLGVVAEGVETEAAWRHLRAIGCQTAQGYLISKPLPAMEIPAWCERWNLTGAVAA